MTRAYDAKSIDVALGLEGPRKNPSMYLGELGPHGTFQCAKEIADNCADDLKELNGGDILIRIVGDSVTVADTGRGIPIDIHPKTKLSGLETVMTLLHAGAKSGAKTAYGRDTIGVHGVGASVVNALSSSMQVWTYRDRSWWTIKFAKGKTIRKLAKAKPPFAWKRGTIVRYERDKTILPDDLPVEMVKAWCDINRYFAPVTIRLECPVAGKQIGYIYKPMQPEQLLRKRLRDAGGDAVTPPFSLHVPGVKLVAAWTSLTEQHVFSSVSGSPTTGGTHVKGLEQAVTDAFTAVFKKKADGVDPMIGLCVSLDVGVDKPAFGGQAKTKLETKEARALVRDAVAPALTKWLKANRDAAGLVVDHAREITKLNTDAANRKVIAKESRQTTGGRISLPKGFISARTFPPAQRELYIVEGDSAGGTASKARMPWQEVLKLRGKLPNVTKKPGKLLTNEEIRKIRCVTGCTNKTMDVGKIILLADADDDGQHIEVQLLDVLINVMPDTFSRGMVYVVKSPLFEGTVKGRQVHGNSIATMEKVHGKVGHVHRMKGWGSASVPLLREVAFSPDTRQLIRVLAPSAKDKTEFDLLMGDDTRARKVLLGLAVK